METATVSENRKGAGPKTCAHSRLIDTLLTADGKRTGKVRCLECGTIFDDPRLRSKIESK